MSCNGCRVLRKGCSEACVLRPCLQWIDAAEAQGHATVFVAKFFGRAGLLSFISAVPDAQRPGLLWSMAPPRSPVPVAAVRGGGADHQPGARRGGAAGHGELAPLPGRRRHRAAGRRHRPAAGAWRRDGPPVRAPRRHRQARRRLVHLLHGEAGAEGRRRCRGAARGGGGGVLRPRAVPQQQPRVPAGDGGREEGPPPAARHAVHELGRVRHDHGRRRQGARAAQPFCLMKPPVDDAGQTKPNHTRSGSLDWPPCDVMFCLDDLSRRPGVFSRRRRRQGRFSFVSGCGLRFYFWLRSSGSRKETTSSSRSRPRSPVCVWAKMRL
ncbi:LOB domain-containing protein 38 [Zea mays]|uniref:LOB domain-containing protein 38 n=1 Tax=Zea mays TaxID=4577 RepID=B6UA03_MAIZE|nr:hypothetical protein [Zea mays]ACN26101.1 unknown [Zea mays]ONL99074.1 LOB domain-containing protein 38 [Zea mays]